MLEFERFELANGLEVIVHEDPSSAMVVLNTLYHVGSKYENPNKTGFAHLFEHLMFGGSKNVPDFDAQLQRVGGTSNAFTSQDLTNYYMTLPANNLETGFWVESDRMMSLSFDPKVLEVQRKVVIEEFKQRYLNQPYGDLWLKLLPLCYKEHSYRWATIGKEISHIEDAVLADVEEFFFQYYRPSNATLVLAGNVTVAKAKQLAEKWFGGIPGGERNRQVLPTEPTQTKEQNLEVFADVPDQLIYKAYHMPSRNHADYFATDLLSDLLGRGKSSRLHEELVKNQQLFASLSAYVSGNTDPGLLVISGKLKPGVDFAKANEMIQVEVDKIKSEVVEEFELAKVKNQAEASLSFSEVELSNRAYNLAYAANLGDPNLVNKNGQMIQAVTPDDIHRVASQILTKENCSNLYYAPDAKN